MSSASPQKMFNLYINFKYVSMSFTEKAKNKIEVNFVIQESGQETSSS